MPFDAATYLQTRHNQTPVELIEKLEAIDKERIASLVAAFFKRASDPTPQDITKDYICCTAALRGMEVIFCKARVASEEQIGDAVKEVRRQFPELINALASFGLSRYSNSHFDRLKTAFDKPCGCDMKFLTPFCPPKKHLSILLHSVNAPPPMEEAANLECSNTSIVASSVLYWLWRIVNHLHSGSLRLDSGKKNKSLETISGYLLYDADAIVEACQQWLTRTGCSITIEFLATCMRRDPAYISPAIVSRLDLVPSIAQELERISLGVTQGYIPQREFHASSPTIRRVEHLTSLIFTVGRSSAVQGPDGAARLFLAQHAAQLFDAFVRFIDHFVATGWKSVVSDMAFDFVDTWRSMAAVIGNCIPPGRDRNIRASALSRVSKEASAGVASSLAALKGDESVVFEAFMLFCLEVEEERCANPACCKSPQQGLKFDHCSMCKVSSYCSSECQRIMWKLPDYPHRQVCNVAAKLRPAWLKYLPNLASPGECNQNQPTRDNLVKELQAIGYGVVTMKADLSKFVKSMNLLWNRRQQRDVYPTSTMPGYTAF